MAVEARAEAVLVLQLLDQRRREGVPIAPRPRVRQHRDTASRVEQVNAVAHIDGVALHVPRLAQCEPFLEGLVPGGDVSLRHHGVRHMRTPDGHGRAHRGVDVFRGQGQPRLRQPGAHHRHHRTAGRRRSGVEVRDQLAFELGDHVLQDQPTLFQATDA